MAVCTQGRSSEAFLAVTLAYATKVTDAEALKTIRLFDAAMNKLIYKSAFPRFTRLDANYTLCDEAKWMMPVDKDGNAIEQGGRIHIGEFSKWKDRRITLSHWHCVVTIPKKYLDLYESQAETKWQEICGKVVLRREQKYRPSAKILDAYDLDGWARYISDHEIERMTHNGITLKDIRKATRHAMG